MQNVRGDSSARLLDETGRDSRGRPVGVAVDREGALVVADDVGNTV
jgi:glucose/arabinose dehydrogenase